MPGEACVGRDEDVRAVVQPAAHVARGHHNPRRRLGAQDGDGPRGGEPLAQLLREVQGAAGRVGAALRELEPLLVRLRPLDPAPHAALVEGDEADEVVGLHRLLGHGAVGDLAGHVDAPQAVHLVDVDEADVAGGVAQPGVPPSPLRVVVHDALEAERELDDVGGDLGGGVEVGERGAVVHYHHDLDSKRSSFNLLTLSSF